MGCVYNRGTRAQPNFWINWREHGKNRYQRIGSDKALAKSTLAQIEGNLQKRKLSRRYGVETTEAPSAPTFDAAADAFIERRSALDVDGKPMRRNWKKDRGWLKNHLRPALGQLHLDEIDTGRIRVLVDALRKQLKPQSIRNCLAIVSRIYNEMPRAMRLDNPVGGMDDADRDSIGAAWDPKATPCLRDDEDVRAVFLAMPDLSVKTPWRAMFAVGAFAGLRPGEIRALEWADVDTAAGTIHVRRSVDGPLKDDESRIAPLGPELAAVLKEWRGHCPVGSAMAFPSTGRRGRYVKEHTLAKVLRAALAAVNEARTDGKLPRMKWYWCTRHTFASRYVQRGGSLMKLASILGHSTAEVTLVYAHLQPGNFSDDERSLAEVQLAPAKVLPMRRQEG